MLGPEMNDYVLVTTSESDEKGHRRRPGAINGGMFKKSADKPGRPVRRDRGRRNADHEVGRGGRRSAGEPMEIPGYGLRRVAPRPRRRPCRRHAAVWDVRWGSGFGRAKTPHCPRPQTSSENAFSRNSVSRRSSQVQSVTSPVGFRVTEKMARSNPANMSRQRLGSQRRRNGVRHAFPNGVWERGRKGGMGSRSHRTSSRPIGHAEPQDQSARLAGRVAGPELVLALRFVR